MADVSVPSVVSKYEDIPYSKWNVVAWTMYDIANTVFSMGIVSLTILHYGIILGMQQGYTYEVANLIASGAVTISTFIVAIFMPVWGAYADSAGKRKPFVVVMGALCILFTAFIFLFNDLLIALSLFVIANVAYQWGNLFYDAMIPHISPPHLTGRVSSFGIALGYAGSIVALSLNVVATMTFGEPTDIKQLETLTPGSSEIISGHLRYMFPLSAIAFLLIAIPFLLTRERTTPSTKSYFEVAKESFTELKNTTRKVLRYRDMLLFIIAWFILSDAVNTVIAYMKVAAVHGLRFNEGQATILLGIGIFGAVLLTYPIGPIADKKGPKAAFYVVGTAWIIATLFIIFSGLEVFGVVIPVQLAYVAAILIGMALGGTWVVQRQMVIELAPPEDVTQYFGFSKFTGKISAAIGPMLYSGVQYVAITYFGVDISLSHRLAIATLLIFFIFGALIFMKITDYHDRYVAGERAPYGETKGVSDI